MAHTASPASKWTATAERGCQMARTNARSGGGPRSSVQDLPHAPPFRAHGRLHVSHARTLRRGASGVLSSARAELLEKKLVTEAELNSIDAEVQAGVGGSESGGGRRAAGCRDCDDPHGETAQSPWQPRGRLIVGGQSLLTSAAPDQEGSGHQAGNARSRSSRRLSKALDREMARASSFSVKALACAAETSPPRRAVCQIWSRAALRHADL